MYHPACPVGRGRRRLGRNGLPPLPCPAPEHRQPAASHETALPRIRAPGTDRHAPLPPDGQGNPSAAHHGGDGAAGRGKQPAGEPPARSSPTGYTCPHREEEEKRAGRLLRRQEDRTGAAIRRGTPRLQRQPDRPAKETGGGDGSIRRQPAHPQPDAEQGTGAADTRPRHAGTGRIRRTRTGHIGGAGTVRQAADRHHLRRHRTAVPLRSCHPPGNQA
ncbi:hypothetical protein [Phocaeicola plebeius]|uniref:hypothetical protein n=1 Tax=Phocaeicola plebeius TaxID=310297 RepID=UPI00241DC8C0|nr:hypothetical protein [Phocaeicola plebeius]